MNGNGGRGHGKVAHDSQLQVLYQKDLPELNRYWYDQGFLDLRVLLDALDRPGIAADSPFIRGMPIPSGWQSKMLQTVSQEVAEKRRKNVLLMGDLRWSGKGDGLGEWITLAALRLFAHLVMRQKAGIPSEEFPCDRVLFIPYVLPGESPSDFLDRRRLVERPFFAMDPLFVVRPGEARAPRRHRFSDPKPPYVFAASTSGGSHLEKVLLEREAFVRLGRLQAALNNNEVVHTAHPGRDQLISALFDGIGKAKAMRLPAGPEGADHVEHLALLANALCHTAVSDEELPEDAAERRDSTSLIEGIVNRLAEERFFLDVQSFRLDPEDPSAAGIRALGDQPWTGLAALLGLGRRTVEPNHQVLLDREFVDRDLDQGGNLPDGSTLVVLQVGFQVPVVQDGELKMLPMAGAYAFVRAFEERDDDGQVLKEGELQKRLQLDRDDLRVFATRYFETFAERIRSRAKDLDASQNLERTRKSAQDVTRLSVLNRLLYQERLDRGRGEFQQWLDLRRKLEGANSVIDQWWLMNLVDDAVRVAVGAFYDATATSPEDEDLRRVGASEDLVGSPQDRRPFALDSGIVLQSYGEISRAFLARPEMLEGRRTRWNLAPLDTVSPGRLDLLPASASRGVGGVDSRSRSDVDVRIWKRVGGETWVDAVRQDAVKLSAGEKALSDRMKALADQVPDLPRDCIAYQIQVELRFQAIEDRSVRPDVHRVDVLGFAALTDPDWQAADDLYDLRVFAGRFWDLVQGGLLEEFERLAKDEDERYQRDVARLNRFLYREAIAHAEESLSQDDQTNFEEWWGHARSRILDRFAVSVTKKIERIALETFPFDRAMFIPLNDTWDEMSVWQGVFQCNACREKAGPSAISWTNRHDCATQRPRHYDESSSEHSKKWLWTPLAVDGRQNPPSAELRGMLPELARWVAERWHVVLGESVRHEELRPDEQELGKIWGIQRRAETNYVRSILLRYLLLKRMYRWLPEDDKVRKQVQRKAPILKPFLDRPFREDFVDKDKDKDKDSELSTPLRDWLIGTTGGDANAPETRLSGVVGAAVEVLHLEVGEDARPRDSAFPGFDVFARWLDGHVLKDVARQARGEAVEGSSDARRSADWPFPFVRSLFPDIETLPPVPAASGKATVFSLFVDFGTEMGDSTLRGVLCLSRDEDIVAMRQVGEAGDLESRHESLGFLAEDLDDLENFARTYFGRVQQEVLRKKFGDRLTRNLTQAMTITRHWYRGELPAIGGTYDRVHGLETGIDMKSVLESMMVALTSQVRQEGQTSDRIIQMENFPFDRVLYFPSRALEDVAAGPSGAGTAQDGNVHHRILEDHFWYLEAFFDCSACGTPNTLAELRKEGSKDLRCKLCENTFDRNTWTKKLQSASKMLPGKAAGGRGETDGHFIQRPYVPGASDQLKMMNSPKIVNEIVADPVIMSVLIPLLERMAPGEGLKHFTTLDTRWKSQKEKRETPWHPKKPDDPWKKMNSFLFRRVPWQGGAGTYADDEALVGHMVGKLIEACAGPGAGEGSGPGASSFTMPTGEGKVIAVQFSQRLTYTLAENPEPVPAEGLLMFICDRTEADVKERQEEESEPRDIECFLDLVLQRFLSLKMLSAGRNAKKKETLLTFWDGQLHQDKNRINNTAGNLRNVLESKGGFEPADQVPRLRDAISEAMKALDSVKQTWERLTLLDFEKCRIGARDLDKVICDALSNLCGTSAGTPAPGTSRTPLGMRQELEQNLAATIAARLDVNLRKVVPQGEMVDSGNGRKPGVFVRIDPDLLHLPNLQVTIAKEKNQEGDAAPENVVRMVFETLFDNGIDAMVRFGIEKDSPARDLLFRVHARWDGVEESGNGTAEQGTSRPGLAIVIENSCLKPPSSVMEALQSLPGSKSAPQKDRQSGKPPDKHSSGSGVNLIRTQLRNNFGPNCDAFFEFIPDGEHERSGIMCTTVRLHARNRGGSNPPDGTPGGGKEGPKTNGARKSSVAGRGANPVPDSPLLVWVEDDPIQKSRIESDLVPRLPAFVHRMFTATQPAFAAVDAARMAGIRVVIVTDLGLPANDGEAESTENGMFFTAFHEDVGVPVVLRTESRPPASLPHRKRFSKDRDKDEGLVAYLQKFLAPQTD